MSKSLQSQPSPLEQIDAITKIMSRLHDIKKGNIIFGLSDLEDFLRHDLDKVGYMLDDLRNELTPDYPDQQRALVHELHTAVEERIA